MPRSARARPAADEREPNGAAGGAGRARRGWAALALSGVALATACQGQAASSSLPPGPSAPPSTVAAPVPVPVAITGPGSGTPAPGPAPTAALAASGPPTSVAVSQVLRLGEGGLGAARFGDDPERTVGYLTGLLGRPDDDTDWGPPATAYGTCPGTEARIVRWGWLVAVLSGGGDASVTKPPPRRFVGWRYGTDVDADALYPADLTTTSAIGLGAPVAALQTAYPGAVAVVPGTPARFEIGTSFRGRLDGTGTVVRLEAGAACS
jgi:hypothetical protein